MRKLRLREAECFAQDPAAGNQIKPGPSDTRTSRSSGSGYPMRPSVISRNSQIRSINKNNNAYRSHSNKVKGRRRVL